MTSTTFRIPCKKFQGVFRTLFASGLTVFAAMPAAAKATLWTVDAANSRIELTGVVNGEPRTVTLPNLSGTINFDPAQPATASIAVDIPITGISDHLAEAVSTLKSASWFDVKAYPLATYNADGIEPADPDAASQTDFTANGTLTLKGVETQIPITFTFDDGVPTAESASTAATATAAINRIDFDIGADWNKQLPSYKIGEDIDVTIYIHATAASVDAPATDTQQPQ